MRGRPGVLPALALALVLTACSGGDASDDEVRPGGTVRTVSPGASSSAAPSSAATAPLDAGAVLNERGNIVKQVGEAAAIRRSADPDAPTVLTFTVEQFVVNPECDSGFEQAPETGNYLGIALRVETTADYDPRQVRKFSEYDFSILQPDGTPLPEVIGFGQTCFGEEDELSHRRFGPGEQYEGWIVLDMPIRAGTVIYAPASEPNGWEWQF